MKILTSTAAATLALGLLAASPASGAGSVSWDGKRGASSPTTCAQGQAPFLHWVLTPGGKDKIPTTGTDLNVDGTIVSAQREGKGTGSLHFYTPYTAPATIRSAVVHTTGTVSRNSLLTISSGCSVATQSPPAGDVDGALPCNTSQTATGGAGVTVNVHDVGGTSGTVTLEAIAWSIPDRFTVTYQGQVVIDETIGDDALWSGYPDLGAPSIDPVSSKTYTIPFSGASSQMTITVTGPGGTGWDYRISCAS